MGTIVVGTTPTIYITDFNVIKPLEIERASLIISRYGKVLLEKTLDDAEVTGEQISWDLTQEETIAIGKGDVVVSCNFIIGDKRYATPESAISFVRNLKEGVM